MTMTDVKGFESFERIFTTEGQDVWETVEWDKRSVRIVDTTGKVVFEQHDIEAPTTWSQQAVQIAASKYFRGQIGTDEREVSVRQLIERVVSRIICWSHCDTYFENEDARFVFKDELTYILLHQIAAFNSPVWFNLGWQGRRQAISACYLLDVKDDMESILNLYKIEGMLFKDGSGSGINLSTLRSSKDKLKAGGYSSGPVSFMKGLDASAGSIKSGGATRRAAILRCLNDNHPDILEFVRCKADAELKAHALVEAGFDGSFNVPYGAYDSVPFQNANHSVRISDAFMSAAIHGNDWPLKSPVDGHKLGQLNGKDLLREIAKAAWICGDPGVQFDDTINTWHTCPQSGRINTTNPCGEFSFLDNTACNLSSINLLKFFDDETQEFNVEQFAHVCNVMILAQEIMVGFADYPTEQIKQNSIDFRPLGLGYANLGALLMSLGVAYDSDEGRGWAACITSIMTACAYGSSALISKVCTGPFNGYELNKASMLKVLKRHMKEAEQLKVPEKLENLKAEGIAYWKNQNFFGREHGYRNAQVTLLAPCGTIGFLMDCATTGIEPDIALVKYKTLVGGGSMKLVNQTVPSALRNLGYTDGQISSIVRCIHDTDTIETCAELLPEHLPVFDCALKPTNGLRSIQPMGHLKMMASVQPFLSGSISKTINCSEDITVEEIEKLYTESWKLGIKAVALYRDNCKRTQPMSTSDPSKKNIIVTTTPVPIRRRLPDERHALTHKFSIGNYEGYITAGLYEDGTPGEIFVTMSKEGSTISGLMDGWAVLFSTSLQNGVPLRNITDKFINSRFEPAGYTKHPSIKIATSILDYICRWMLLKFEQIETKPTETKPMVTSSTLVTNPADAPLCPVCGAITVRNGNCHRCLVCGESLGCS